MNATAGLRVSASDLSDAADGNVVLTGIRPVWDGARTEGPALTVAINAGDHRSVFTAIDNAEPGHVLVIAPRDGTDAERCVFGEVTSIAAMERGIAGVVVDGLIRDVDAIRDLRFPVFARGVTPRGPRPRTEGQIGGTVIIAHRTIHVGDHVVGDGDGVVTVPAADRNRLLAIATGVVERERHIIAGLRAGRSVLDFTDELRNLNEGNLS